MKPPPINSMLLYIFCWVSSDASGDKEIRSSLLFAYPAFFKLSTRWELNLQPSELQQDAVTIKQHRLRVGCQSKGYNK